MKTNRAVIVQCRLSSTRLPGKALMDLDGKPVLGWVLSSMRKVRADRYFVATDYDSYEKIKPVCDEYGFECFAGNLEDVLKRFCDLIETLNVKTIIRATADNPFLFYEAAEESAADFEERNSGKMHCDYLTWSGLPHGSGVEIFRADSLLKAAAETSSPYDHEHVGPALYKHTDKYKCDFVKAPRRFNHPQLRTTIDTYSDYLRALSIVSYVRKNYHLDDNEPFTTEQIIQACNSKSVKCPVILVPSVVKGHGTGHLHRCLSLALQSSFFVYIPQDSTLEETENLLQEYRSKGLKSWQIISKMPDQTYLPVIITDTFELTKKQIEEFSNNQSLMAIDEGSDFSDYCDYLLDIIPSYKVSRDANLFDSGYITKPENKKPQGNVNSISKVLVCLGGEDPSGFTVPAVNAITQCFPDAHITAVISGDKSSFVDNSQNYLVEYIEPVPNLKEKLADYDLVITHYGLTAFESVYAGCGVILLPTTKLHVNLAQKYNFAHILDKNLTAQSFRHALASENLFPPVAVSEENKNLAEYIEKLSAGEKILCPVCDKAPLVPDEIISRNATRTYRRCRNCGIVYMAWTVEEDKKYQKAYFFEDYKKQYGKTYQEDFDSIKAQCLRRLSIINQVNGSLGDKSVLDIGCAYGPFLAAAADYNMNPFGTDISEDAVDYVQKQLHYPATCSAFPAFEADEEFGLSEFDVVTMWYVIEHFKNLDEVLRKVSSITKKGGIFAFSTPSGEGVSALTNCSNFYQNSPTDHYTIWEPSRAANILKKYGFEVIKIVSTGHHPERFPSIKRCSTKKGSLRWKCVEMLSKTKKLGDTFEIYCKKI